MIAEKPLEINAYIERGDGNGLGVVKTKAGKWPQLKSLSFTPGLIGLVFSIQRISKDKSDISISANWISSPFKNQF